MIREVICRAAVARICGIGGSIGTGGAGFTRSVITGRYAYITHTIITISAVTGIRAGIACAAVACICGIGRLIGTGGAVITISPLACRGADASGTVIAEAAVTSPRAAV